MVILSQILLTPPCSDLPMLIITKIEKLLADIRGNIAITFPMVAQQAIRFSIGKQFKFGAGRHEYYR